MQVYKVGIAEIAIGPLASKLKSLLLSGPTIWLVPGGSNIKLSVAIMQQLDSNASTNLTIALTDERYGKYDHPDSNWAQLKAAGFDPKKAKTIEVLSPKNLSLGDTIAAYEQRLTQAMDDTENIIGQFGMGADGHIAGIIPGTPADDESLAQLVTGYEAQPFTRITLTFAGIKRVSTAFLIAVGQEKRTQLDRLINYDVALSDQPAQIIKQIPESYLYNDQIEGSKK